MQGGQELAKHYQHNLETALLAYVLAVGRHLPEQKEEDMLL